MSKATITEVEPEARPAARSHRAAPKKVLAPSADALKKPLNRLLGLASVIFAWYATRAIKNDAQREAVQDAMEMTAQERNDISEPLANIFSRTSLAARIGRYIVESDDYVALGEALFIYGSRVYESLKVIGESTHVARGETRQGAPVSANGHQPAAGVQLEQAAIYNALQDAA